MTKADDFTYLFDTQGTLFQTDTKLILTEKNMFLFCYAFKHENGVFPGAATVLTNFWSDRSVIFLRMYAAAKNLLEHETILFNLSELSTAFINDYITVMMQETYKVINFDSQLATAYHNSKKRQTR